MRGPKRITITTISKFWQHEEAICQAEADILPAIFYEQGAADPSKQICGAPATHRIVCNYASGLRELSTGFVCKEHVGNVVEWWLSKQEEEEAAAETPAQEEAHEPE